jgi:cytochrome c553
MRNLAISALALAMFVAATPVKKDAYPRACVDCHAKPEMRISVLLQKPNAAMTARLQPLAPKGVKLAGKHPAVAFAFKDIPAKCLTCHGPAAKNAPQFPRMMHVIHLTDGQGECVNCHKYSAATGDWKIPSAAE